MSKPTFLPQSAGEAFKHINAVTAPTIDDLKLMVYLEASGQVGYGDLADSAPMTPSPGCSTPTAARKWRTPTASRRRSARLMARTSRCQHRPTIRMRKVEPQGRPRHPGRSRQGGESRQDPRTTAGPTTPPTRRRPRCSARTAIEEAKHGARAQEAIPGA